MKKLLITIAFMAICSAVTAQNIVYRINGKNVTKEEIEKLPVDRIKTMEKSVDSDTFDNVINIVLKDAEQTKTTQSASSTEMIDYLKVGDKAPALRGRDSVDGKKVKSTKGKVVLLNFWATWCAPCVQELRDPAFGELVERFSADKKFRFVAAAVDTDSQVEKFVNRIEECAFLKGCTLSDSDRKLMHRFASSGIPRTYVIDADGTIVYAHLGMLRAADFAELGTLIEQTLK